MGSGVAAEGGRRQQSAGLPGDSRRCRGAWVYRIGLDDHGRGVRAGASAGGFAPQFDWRAARWRLGHHGRRTRAPLAESPGRGTDGALDRAAWRRPRAAREFSSGAVRVARFLGAAHLDAEVAVAAHITITRLKAPFDTVGVVWDTKSRGLEVETPMAIFTAYPQWTWQSVSLTLRTEGDPRALTKALGAMVAAVDRDQPVTSIR